MDTSNQPDGLNETGKRIGEMASNARSKLADTLHVGERTDKLARDVEERATLAYDSVVRQVKERPGLAIGIATGAGVLLGLMLTRRQ